MLIFSSLRQNFVTLIFLLLSCFSIQVKADALLALKKPNHFGIMRHSLAPGTGDPSGFKIDDCKTQRNLSPAGLQQAIKLGERIKKSLGSEVEVLTSQWCRCQDTANALALMKPKVLKQLNSFFRTPGSASQQIKELKTFLTDRFSSIEKENKMPLILVTHQVNITKLLDVYPDSGELFIVHYTPSGKLRVVETVP